MTDTTSNSFPRPAIALLGAGTMGSAMAQRLLDLGFRVDVWNRTATPLAALTQHGATASRTPSEAVAIADVVVTMLPNADVVEASLACGNASLYVSKPAIVQLLSTA